jgi:hypothetical protein
VTGEPTSPPAPLTGIHTAGRRVFALVVWGLSIHVLAIALLYGPIGLSAGLVRAIAGWKELILLILLATTLWRIGRERWLSALTLPDVAAGALVLWIVTRGVVDYAHPNGGPPAVIFGYGARDLAQPLLLYAIGRATPGVATDPALLGRLTTIAVLATIVGIIELLLPIEVLVAAGIPRYFTEFLGVPGITDPYRYNLPNSYFTDLGATSVRRAGSVFLNGQGLAAALLLLIPAAQVRAMFATSARSVLTWGVVGLLWIGLLLSVTRMTTAAVAVESVLLLLLAGRVGAVGAIAAAFTTLTATLVIASRDVRFFLWRTLTFETQSSRSHLADWQDGLEAMWEHPLGAGLATADITAERFGRTPLAADNLYFKYGVELGIPGLLLFVVFLIGVLAAAVQWSRRRAGDERAQQAGLYAAAITVGVIVNGATAVVTNVPFVTYIWGWIAGAVVAAAALPPSTPIAAVEPASAR